MGLLRYNLRFMPHTLLCRWGVMTTLVLLFKAPCLLVVYQTMTSNGMASDFHILSFHPVSIQNGLNIIIFNSLDHRRIIICVESSGGFTLKLMKRKLQGFSLARAPPRLYPPGRVSIPQG